MSFTKYFKSPLTYGIILTLAVITFVIVLASLPYCYVSSDGTSSCVRRGVAFLESPPNEMGDTLAGIAGTLAFLWIIVTVLLQREELKSQKKEIRLTRIESEKTAQALSQQVFDNSFFSILETHNTIVAELDNKNAGREFKGRDVFKIHHEVLLGMFKRKEKRVSSKLSVDQVSNVYDVFWYHERGDLGHYFRYLYRAFQTLEVKDSSSSYHSKLLRAQLSDYELAILFYNCLTKRGEKFLSLAVKFKIFDNLPIELLLEKKHSLWVPEEAFGENEGFIQFKLENSPT